MFKFIQTAYNWVVSKATAACQAVVNFFFGKEEEKEFKKTATSERTEKFDTKMGSFSFVLGFGTPSFTEETAEIVMATAEEFVKDSNDKVELAAALFWVSNNYSAFFKEGGDRYYASMMQYSTKEEVCSKMKERYDALVKRFELATVTRNEYEIGLIGSAKVYLKVPKDQSLKYFLKKECK